MILEKRRLQVSMLYHSGYKKLIALFCKNNIGFLRNIRIAFVINTPHQAALCNIFKDLVENFPLTVEIFCTYERAYSFLDSYKHVASSVCKTIKINLQNKKLYNHHLG